MFAPEVYKARRLQLCEKGLSGLAVFVGAVEAPLNYKDNFYPFVQDGSFRYFFGLNRADLAGVIDLDAKTATLFGHEPDVADIVWTGPVPSLADRALTAGIEHTQDYDELKTILAQAKAAGRPIHFLQPYRGETTMELARLLDIPSQNIPDAFSKELTYKVVEIREIKSDEEIAEMEKALAVTRQMHIAAMKAAKPGVPEYEVAGKMEGIMREKDLLLAYPIIFTRRGEVLHNDGRKGILQAGDLCVNDTGCSAESGYASDITRTIPVGGKFSDKQAAIYNTVLDMQLTAIAAMKPGVRYLDVHKLAARTMVNDMKKLGFFKGDTDAIVESGAYAIAFPHGLGHQIGLDVHDMEAMGEDLVGYGKELQRSKLFGLGYLRMAKTLKKGMVITVEPGVYFIPALIENWKQAGQFAEYINFEQFEAYKDFGGIRIEDNVLITETGSKVLGEAIPKTIAEVEAVMAEI